MHVKNLLANAPPAKILMKHAQPARKSSERASNRNSQFSDGRLHSEYTPVATDGQAFVFKKSHMSVNAKGNFDKIRKSAANAELQVIHPDLHREVERQRMIEAAYGRENMAGQGIANFYQTHQ